MLTNLRQQEETLPKREKINPTVDIARQVSDTEKALQKRRKQQLERQQEGAIPRPPLGVDLEPEPGSVTRVGKYEVAVEPRPAPTA